MFFFVVVFLLLLNFVVSDQIPKSSYRRSYVYIVLSIKKGEDGTVTDEGPINLRCFDANWQVLIMSCLFLLLNIIYFLCQNTNVKNTSSA